MEIVKRINNGEDIFSLLNKMIDEQKLIEKREAYFNLDAGSLEDELDSISKNYEFNKEKLSYISKMEKLTTRAKFMELIQYVDLIKLDENNLVSVLLTLGVLLSRFDLRGFNNDDIYFLATSFISIPPEEYNSYCALINHEVLERIYLKTNDEIEQRKIMYTLFDAIIYNDSTKEELLNIIDVYNCKEAKRI